MQPFKIVRFKIAPFKIALGLILFSGLYCNTVSAELLNGSQWLVKSGDSLYKIARTIFPNDTKQQARLRKELVQKNPQFFKQGPSSLSVGDSLSFPLFATQSKKTLPAIVKKLSPVQPAISKAVAPPAEETIGKVVINIGTLYAENNGYKRKLSRRSDIYQGDTLSTGKQSHTQIRLTDGALISLRPYTDLKLAEYQFNGSEDGSEKSILELLRGGFRTITGLIGHKNKANYQIKTSIATIGIRGTHYSLVLCQQQSCSNDGSSVEDGLYGGVSDGSIVIENGSGIHRFTNDQFFQVTSNTTAPVQFLSPPAVLKNIPKIDNKNETGDKKESRRSIGNNLNTAPRRRAVIVEANQPGRARPLGIRPPPIINSEVINAEIIDAIPTEAPLGSAMLVSFSTGSGLSVAGENYTIDRTVSGTNDSITLLNNRPISAYDDDVRTTYTLSSSSLVPSSLGTLSLASGQIGIQWGRWNNNYTVESAGSVLNTNPDLHYIYSENITPASQLANLGGLGMFVRYDSIAGTLATDDLGNVASLVTDIEFHVDFMAQEMIQYRVDTTVAGVDYSAQQLSPVALRTAIDNGFTLNPGTFCSTCTGSASIQLVGGQAQAAITSFNIEDSASTRVVTGVSVLSRTPPQ